MRKNLLRVGLFVFAITVSGLLFQNCSKVAFQAFETLDNASMGAGLALENGARATNKQVLKAEFINLRSDDYIEMKLYQRGVDPETIPWQPFGKISSVDLGSNYSPDGSKDDVKVVYGALKSRLGEVIEFTDDILLDTVPPEVFPEGLLKTGPDGKKFSVGQSVTISWRGQDKATANSPGSGIDSRNGLKLSLSDTGDCGTDKNSVIQEWSQWTESYSLRWPKNHPRQNFYVCVFAKDQAGNVANVLSAPMTSLWALIAGDNNIGNGGSAFARSVRFSYPNRLASDSQGNLYIYDSSLQTIRKIDSRQNISTVLGTGYLGSAPKSEDPEKFDIPGVRSIEFDSRDRMLLSTSVGLIRVTLDPANRKVEHLVKSGLISAMTIDKSDNVYLGTYSTLHVADQPASDAKAYVVKVNFAGDNNSNSQFTMDHLIQNFAVVGNGDVVKYEEKFPLEVGARSAPIGYIRSLAVGSDGSLYISTIRDGSGRAVGEHLTAVMKSVSGVNKVYKLTTGYAWAESMRLATIQGKTHLLLGGSNQFGSLDVTAVNLPLTTLMTPQFHPEIASEFCHGVAVANHLDGTALNNPIIYVANSSKAKVVRANYKFEVEATIGRKIFNREDKVATQAMVGAPLNSVEDNAGNVYFYEPLNEIIRKVTPSGEISIFAGKPRSDLEAPRERTLSSDFESLLNGQYYNIGYNYILQFNRNSNDLYFTNGLLGKVGRVNLLSYQETVSDSTTSDRAKSGGRGWPIFNTALSPSGELFIFRYLTITPFGGWLEKLTGATMATAVHLGANGSESAATAGPAMSSGLGHSSAATFDEQGNYFFVNGNSLFRLSGSNFVLVASGFSATSIAILHEGDKRHVLGTNSDKLFHITIDSQYSVSPITKICLPGTLLGDPTISVGADGNILISDTWNNRVLRYFIKDESNKIDLSNTECSR